MLIVDMGETFMPQSARIATVETDGEVRVDDITIATFVLPLQRIGSKTNADRCDDRSNAWPLSEGTCRRSDDPGFFYLHGNF